MLAGTEQTARRVLFREAAKTVGEDGAARVLGASCGGPRAFVWVVITGDWADPEQRERV